MTRFKTTYTDTGSPMSGHPARQLVLHNPGVKEATAKGVAAYVAPRGISYHITTEVHDSKETYKIIPFNQSAKSLLTGGIANGIGCNKAGTVRIQVCVINNRQPFRELHGKLPNDFLDLILDICEKYKIPLKYVPHTIGRRVTEKNWINQSGISAHRYAPANDHSDLPLPKSFLRQLKERQKARQGTVTPSKPTKPTTGKDTPTKPKTPSKTVTGTLEKGDTGKRVRKLQRALGGIKVDGDFGPQTESRVKTFQRQKNILPDGIVGRITWKHLGYTMKQPKSHKGLVTKNSDTKWPKTALVEAIGKTCNDLSKKTGKPVKAHITSGWRTPKQQWEFRMLYLRGQGNLAARCCSKYDRTQHSWAQCGKDPWSRHCSKNAADVQINGMDAWAYPGFPDAATKNGLCAPVYSPQRELWHLELG